MSSRSSSSSLSSERSSYSDHSEIDEGALKQANCIRNVGNFSRVKSFHLMEKGDFDPDMLKLYMTQAAPKLTKLFEQIKALDEKDLSQHNKLYKHIIFTDLKSSTYGAKIIASAFLANNYQPAFHVQGPGFSIYPDEKLLETKSNNFAVLMSKSFFDRNMNTRFKKALLQKMNQRPENTHGDLIRFIILDQGFKEGIDLFDVKYVHLFEPLLVKADEKQAIGRGTRFCGQQGLTFNPTFGWPLYVYKYDISIPEENQDKLKNAKTLFELYLQYANIDLRKVNFAAELESVATEAAVDSYLTEPIHKFAIAKPPLRLEQEGGVELRKRVPKPPAEIMNYGKMQTYIKNYFTQFKYPPVKLENNCQSGGAPQIVKFTPTQDFVRHYFQPSSAYKGILFWHTVGVGKTCSAIATATTSFEKQGYTILWVTRHTLKSDIWKNMYQQVCSLVIQEQLQQDKLKLPQKISSPMKYVSKQWMEPISYKQFSNLLLKKNKYYEQMVGRNGSKDPLHKTLLIIDEAHKLYSPTVQASEKPDTTILEEMIQNSYTRSGKDSVKVILMTGTPYTEDAMEMVKLTNLLKEKADHLPTNFNTFSNQYLDESGYFTPQGKKRLLNQLSGYISYVNRSQDARNFAYPVMEEIYVPLSVPSKEDPENLLAKMKEQIKELKKKIKDEKSEAKIKTKACKAEEKANLKISTTKLKEVKKGAEEKCKTLPVKERPPCKEAATKQFQEDLTRAEQTHAQLHQDCLAKITNIETIKEYENEVTDLKTKVDASRITKKGINTQLKELQEEMKTEKAELKELKEEYTSQRAVLGRIANKEAKKKEAKRLRETLGKDIKLKKKEVLALRNKIVEHTLTKKKLMLEEGSKGLGNISQLKALHDDCNV